MCQALPWFTSGFIKQKPRLYDSDERISCVWAGVVRPRGVLFSRSTCRTCGMSEETPGETKSQTRICLRITSNGRGKASSPEIVQSSEMLTSIVGFTHKPPWEGQGKLNTHLMGGKLPPTCHVATVSPRQMSTFSWGEKERNWKSFPLFPSLSTLAKVLFCCLSSGLLYYCHYGPGG